MHIRIIATSTPVTKMAAKARFRGCQRLAERGFRLSSALNCGLHNGYCAGSIAERVRSLHDAFLDQDVDIVMSFWGGFQTNQLLEYIDFDLLKENWKPCIGYSDLTAFQVAAYASRQIKTFSGPSIVSFCKPIDFNYTWHYFQNVVLGDARSVEIRPSWEWSDTHWWRDNCDTMQCVVNAGWRVFDPEIGESYQISDPCRRGERKEVIGPLIGGNLGSMLLLAGTQWWPDMTGHVLFVEEDEDETPYTIDRMFTQLRHIGVFNQISALLIGRFPRSVGLRERDGLDGILREALKGYSFPVLYDLDFGHTDPIVTWPIGNLCRVTISPCSIELLSGTGAMESCSRTSP